MPGLMRAGAIDPPVKQAKSVRGRLRRLSLWRTHELFRTEVCIDFIQPRSPATDPPRPGAAAGAEDPPDHPTGRGSPASPPGAPSRPGAPPGDAGRPSPGAAGPGVFPPPGLGGAAGDGPAGSLRQGQPGPAELPGHKILKVAVGGGEQGLHIGRAQKFRPIPGQVPPGQKAQVQRSPGDAQSSGYNPGPPGPRRAGPPGPPGAGWPGAGPRPPAGRPGRWPVAAATVATVLQR